MTKFCICSTCTHSDGFPTESEMPDASYTEYLQLPDGTCIRNPPTLVMVPASISQMARGSGTLVPTSIFPPVSPVGRCSQWASEDGYKASPVALEAPTASHPVPKGHLDAGRA